MRKLGISIAVMLAVLTAEAKETLFENGTSKWKIAVPAKASALEQYAADELRIMIKKISGTEIPVVKTDEIPASKTIVIGSPETSPAVKSKKQDLKLQDDKTENIAVYTIGENLYLAGSNPRGALYAVYFFLQKELGVRWFWPGDDGEFFTALKKYDIADLSVNYKPPFRYREMTPCYEQFNIPTQVWCARNFLNGGARTEWIIEKGGFYRHDGQHWVSLEKKNFDLYPEYYSVIGGKHVPEGVAGCWSNPGFLKMMVNRHLKLIEENKFEILKTIHADVTQRCECQECTKNPDPSSRWFEFYAKLAAEIHKVYPDVRFSASAYQEHRQVPKDDIKAIEYVEYCHYNRCYVHKLNDPGCKMNLRSISEIREWQKKIPMAVYGYEMDVFSPTMYVPFWNMLADEMRTFRDMGIIRVKTELQVMNTKSKERENIAQLKMRIANYAYAQLAWNPDADMDAILKDFCSTVYGSAANIMYAYHSEMAKTWDSMDIHLTYFLVGPGGASAYMINNKLSAFAKAKFAEAKAEAAKEPSEAVRKRISAEIRLEEAFFTEWEKLHNVTNVDAVACVTKLQSGNTSDSIKSLLVAARSEKSHATEIKMYWTDDALHIQAVCHDPEMAKLRKGKPGRDVELWTDDTIEIFLDLNDGTPFRHMAANPAGGQYDAIIDEITWNPNWKSVTELKNDRWIMNISLPFESFGGKTPKEGDQWKIMVIRNNKSGSSGYPAVAHHDMSRAATLYFSDNSDPRKNLLWISSPGVSEGKRYGKLIPDLLKRGWQTDNVRKPEEAMSKDPASANLIVIEKYKNKLPAEFYTDKLIPAVKNGAVVVFSCYFGLEDLHKIFGNDSFKVTFTENGSSMRRITWPADSSFTEKPNNLRKSTIFPPSGTLTPAFPEQWEVLARQKTIDDSDMPFIIARPLGKGMVVVAGDIKNNIKILENILEYNNSIKR